MTLTRTHITKAIRPAVESPYPIEQVLMTVDGPRPIYLGHPKATCVQCEHLLSNERMHPRSTEHEGLIDLCGGLLMRLTDRKAP